MTSTTGIGVHDQNLERQIEKHMGGCMAGFFNLFDRSHLLSGKRLYPKRLPAPLPSSVSLHSLISSSFHSFMAFSSKGLYICRFVLGGNLIWFVCILIRLLPIQLRSRYPPWNLRRVLESSRSLSLRRRNRSSGLR